MLRYLARIVPFALRAAARADGRSISRIRRRVRWSQIDINRHMNQAEYAREFEMGRLDWFVRSGMWSRWRAVGVHPVMAEQRIVYRRELAPFQAYTIDTRAVGLDGRLLRFEQLLLVGDRVHAKCECKLIFIGPNGVLRPDELPALTEDRMAEALPVADWQVTRG